jgi:flagellar biosynthesis activator protein FlaF
MLASLQASAAYSRNSAPVRTARDSEYEVFARITRRLRAAAQQDFPALVAALHENQRLWATLAEDLASPGNELPDSLRAGLLNLAIFTSRHSNEVLGGRASPDVLVEINTAVMRGLRGDTATP